MDIQRQFVETIRSWLILLPHDLKILYEAAADENLARDARELAVGAIIYIMAPSDLISDRNESFLSYTDDCLLLHMALEQIGKGTDEDTELFKSRFPEFFEKAAGELDICKQAMPDLYAWLLSKVDQLKTREYKGKKVAQFIDDDEASEFLYEEGLGFRTEYPVDEETLADKLKKASTVIDVIQRRKDDEDRSKGHLAANK